MPGMQKLQSVQYGDKTYRTSRNSDGTWNIHDVEIFAAHSRFGKTFDARWLQKAIVKAKVRESEGYLPPLHIYHTGTVDSNDLVKAGHFKPTMVAKRPLGGELTDVMLADYVEIPDEIMARIERGELPYRSVELSTRSFDDPEIGSVAMLENESPFFKFPNLKASRNDAAEPVLAGMGDDFIKASMPGVLRYSTMLHDDAAMIGFNPDAISYTATYTSSNNPFEKKKKEEEEEPQAEEMPQPNNEQQPPVQQAPAPVEENSGEDAEVAKAAVKVAEIDAKAAMVQQIMNLMGDLLRSLTAPEPKEEKEEMPDSDYPEEDDKEVVGGPITMSEDTRPTVPSLQPLAHAPKDNSNLAYAELQGKIAALEARLKEKEYKDNLAKSLAAAYCELEKFGCTDSSKENLAEIADKHGEAGIAAYMAAVRTHGTPDPEHNETDDDILTGGESDHPVISKYADRGPLVQREVRDLLTMYNDAPDSLKRMFSSEQFVEAKLSVPTDKEGVR